MPNDVMAKSGTRAPLPSDSTVLWESDGYQLIVRTWRDGGPPSYGLLPPWGCSMDTGHFARVFAQWLKEHP